MTRRDGAKQMAQAVKFADKMSSRNEGVIIADHGNKVEVRVWINPTQRFHPVTKMVEKRWIGRAIRLSPRQQTELAAFA